MTEFEKLCAEYKENKNLIKELEEMNDTIKKAILTEMNGADTMTRGAYKASYTPQNRGDIDKPNLKKDHPDIYAAYWVVTPTKPVFRVS